VSVGISDSRLAKKRIAVANSEAILIAGKVKKVFFDKTGTLTKQGLDFVSAKCKKTWANNDNDAPLSKELSLGMAVCHNLTLSKAGNLVGNSVDVIMFEASGGTLSKTEEAGIQVTDSTGEVVTMVKHFEFDHHIALQSVIVSDSSGRLVAFVKGSDEGIKKRCAPETLPSDYDLVAKESARNGVYQISMAMKVLSDDGLGVDLVNISRNEIEQNLTFVGVINFKNLLREETPGVIQELKGGDCQVTIITGDHVLTGIRIAKEAGIIEPSRRVLLCTKVEDGKAVWKDEDDEVVSFQTIEELKAEIDLAITGEAWASLCTYQPRLAQRIASYIRVFGRCTPNDKVGVVATFVKQGFITLMCGDGGNDCGALKTAHVGVALSDAEASVVSPFTSLDKCVSAVPEVLREGRCALASSISSYKFMISYGQLETISQTVNAYFQITFLEWNWVFLDGIWTITLAFSLPLAKSAARLAPARPTASLLGLRTVSSACGILFLNFVFFAGALFLLFSQDWYLCRRWGNTANSVSSVTATGDNYESEVIFLVSGYQYISSAMAFNYGFEFRQGWLRNYVFVAFVTAYTIMHIYIILVPSRLSCFWRVNCDNKDAVRWVTKDYPVAIQNVFNTTVMPASFRWKLFFYILGNTLAVQGYEYFIVNGIGRKVCRDIKKRRELQKVEPPLLDDDNFAYDSEIVKGGEIVKE
jgi:cation-transporting ATPase 13A3/4/5